MGEGEREEQTGKLFAEIGEPAESSTGVLTSTTATSGSEGEESDEAADDEGSDEGEGEDGDDEGGEGEDELSGVESVETGQDTVKAEVGARS